MAVNGETAIMCNEGIHLQTCVSSYKKHEYTALGWLSATGFEDEVWNLFSCLRVVSANEM